MAVFGCPFCGQEPRLDTIVTASFDDDGGEVECFAIYCPDGECLGHTCREYWYGSVESAVDAWNRRPQRLEFADMPALSLAC